MLILLAASLLAQSVPVYPGARLEPRRSAQLSQGARRVSVYLSGDPVMTVVRFYERRTGERAVPGANGRYAWEDLGLSVEPNTTGAGTTRSVILMVYEPPSVGDLEQPDSEAEGENPEISPPETPPRASEL